MFAYRWEAWRQSRRVNATGRRFTSKALAKLLADTGTPHCNATVKLMDQTEQMRRHVMERLNIRPAPSGGADGETPRRLSRFGRRRRTHPASSKQLYYVA